MGEVLNYILVSLFLSVSILWGGGLAKHYKNLWKFCHEGNCSASWGLGNDDEQFSWVSEFSIGTEQPLKIFFLAYCSFDNSI